MSKSIYNTLITGSSGFVGTNFIALSSNFNIRTVDLLVVNPTDINFEAIDSVIHLAAIVHQMKGASEQLYFKINRDLAFEVAKRAKDQGVKQFVLMSTAKVYGESTIGSAYWNENSACKPLDPYGKSKYEAEKLIRGLEDENFKVAIVRSPLVYGAGVKANMFSLIRLVDRLPILPLGGIHNERSIVYIGNLVALLTRIIEDQASGVFIAGDRSPLSTTEMIQLIAAGFKKRVFLPRVPRFVLDVLRKLFPSIIDRLYGSLVLDNSNTNRVLNFVPPYSSEDGLREMVEWYKSRNRE